MNGIVTIERAGDSARPSPAIWAKCPGNRLLDEGTGVFIHEDFFGGVVAAATTAATPLSPHFTFVGDTDTITTKKAGEVGGYLDIETDGDDNDGAALVTAPILNFSLYSERQVWAEARMELGAVADQGIFFGLAEAAGLTHDVVADGGAALIGESLVGIQILSDDQDAADAVYKLDGGSAVVVRSIMNPAALTADTEFKIGLHFDGKKTLRFFFDGEKVGEATLSAATFPNNVDMGLVLAIKTGTGAAVSMAVDWIRVAGQLRK